MIIIFIIILASVSLYFALRPQGNYVEIRLDGKIIYNLPLDENKTIELDEIGLIVIENKTVRMIESSCPDKLCVHQGSISRAGQSIICLPNRLVITIRGESEWDVIV